MKKISVIMLAVFFLLSCELVNDAYSNLAGDELTEQEKFARQTSPQVIPLLPCFVSDFSRINIQDVYNFDDIDFLLNCPLLYQFEKNSSSEYLSGDRITIKNSIFGDLLFETSRYDTRFSFVGTNEDNSIEININYNLSLNEFYYTQKLYLENDSNTYFIYLDTDNPVGFNEELNFQGEYNLITIYTTNESGTKLYQTKNAVAEWYCGSMLDDTSGSGCAIRDVYHAFSETDFSFLPDDSVDSNLTKPVTDADLKNLDYMSLYSPIYSFNSFNSKNDYDTHQVNQVFYNFSGNVEGYQDVSLEGDRTIQEFISLFPETWGETSLYLQ